MAVATEQSLAAVAEAVARRITTVQHEQNTSILSTPLLYPSGASILVELQRTGGRFRVSDMGSGFTEASMIGATGIFLANAPKIAKRSGVAFQADAFFVLEVSENQLVGAVITVANASKECMDLTTLRLAEKRYNDAKARLYDRLERVFKRPNIERNVTIIGGSSREWEVAAVVHFGRHSTVFEPVNNKAVSIYRTVTAFHDIVRAPGHPQCVAVVRDKNELGDSLGLLSQAGKVVNEDVSDASLRRVVAAA